MVNKDINLVYDFVRNPVIMRHCLSRVCSRIIPVETTSLTFKNSKTFKATKKYKNIKRVQFSQIRIPQEGSQSQNTPDKDTPEYSRQRYSVKDFFDF